MAQVAPPLTYPHHIPSVHQSNGGVPAVLGALDLNRSAQAGKKKGARIRHVRAASAAAALSSALSATAPVTRSSIDKSW